MMSDVTHSVALREGTEKDENGDYFGRRQYQDTASKFDVIVSKAQHKGGRRNG